MKVLAVAQYSGLTGGSNRSLLMVLTLLRELYNYEVVVVVPNDGPLCDALVKAGIQYIVLKYHEIGGISKRSISNYARLFRYRIWSSLDRREAKRFAKSIMNEGFDLVYINDINHYIGCYIAKFLSIPYIWHFRSVFYPQMIYNAESIRLFRGASNIITISGAMKNQLIQGNIIDPRRVSMILNGVPLDGNNKISKQDTTEGFNIVECGRVTRDKGHTDAINAISILKQRGIEDIHLHIVGDFTGKSNREYVNELKRIIDNQDLINMVSFEGICDDMLSYREHMNVELVCSVCEPFGRVTVEGMRSGLVVIGSNTGGTKEIIKDKETGLLYEQGDSEDLANKIYSVYINKDYRNELVKRALVFSNSHFTPEQNVMAINNVMQKVINEV